MSKTKNEEGTIPCPVCRFFAGLERASGGKAEFFKHLDKSRVEFLRAVRSLVDARIETIEQAEGEGKTKKKATKISVE